MQTRTRPLHRLKLLQQASFASTYPLLSTRLLTSRAIPTNSARKWCIFSEETSKTSKSFLGTLMKKFWVVKVEMVSTTQPVKRARTPAETQWFQECRVSLTCQTAPITTCKDCWSRRRAKMSTMLLPHKSVTWCWKRSKTRLWGIKSAFRWLITPVTATRQTLQPERRSNSTTKTSWKRNEIKMLASKPRSSDLRCRDPLLLSATSFNATWKWLRKKIKAKCQ